MVCVGAAMLRIVSIEGFGDAIHHPYVSLYPSRVAAQVASGIGFLGAGATLMRRGVVHGLTTAVSLWAVAALGLAVGGGLYGAAIAATLIMLVILMARIGRAHARTTVTHAQLVCRLLIEKKQKCNTHK